MSRPLPWVIAASTATFAVADWLAAHNGTKGDTASEFMRRAAGINPPRPWRPVGVAVIIGGCGWLAAHLITGKV